MEKVFVVKRVAEKLWASEDAIDGAIAKASVLMGGLVEAKEELKLSATFTDEATSKIAESMKALADARRAMVEAHAALNECQLRLGVRVKAGGFKPPVEPSQDATVAERRAS